MTAAAAPGPGPAELRLRRAAVIGAAGKMGNGIAWVLLQAMAAFDAARNGVPGSGQFELTLVDRDWEGLKRLRLYLRRQLEKFAEKRMVDLRTWARERADLVENGEIIAAFVEGGLACVRCDTHLEAADKSTSVFEAVFENLELKADLFRRLKAICPSETYFFTNTSSIPISALDQAADLGGRVLGYHFYNPPAVQKLVEVIAARNTDPALIALGRDLGKALGKILVPSRDVAGFIGNGHFIREGLYALEQFAALRKDLGDAEAVYLVNKATQDFLIRPMGLFQLLDYVGLDVFEMITQVMGRYLPGESFASPVLSQMLANGAKGGQAGSGEQKDGFFRYEKNRPAAVYSLQKAEYVPLDAAGLRKAEAWLGELPAGHAPWGKLSKDPKAGEKLAVYFAALAKAPGEGAALARAFLKRSRRIAEGLVASQVAASPDDVAAVLKNGFYHLYGPFDFAV